MRFSNDMIKKGHFTNEKKSDIIEHEVKAQLCMCSSNLILLMKSGAA